MKQMKYHPRLLSYTVLNIYLLLLIPRERRYYLKSTVTLVIKLLPLIRKEEIGLLPSTTEEEDVFAFGYARDGVEGAFPRERSHGSYTGSGTDHNDGRLRFSG